MLSELKSRRRSKRISDDIDKQLRDYKKEMDYSIRILLLGTDKTRVRELSTQIKLAYGFSDEEQEKLKRIITSRVVTSMESIICFANTIGLDMIEKETANKFKTEAMEAYGTLTPSLGKSIKLLWKDPGIRAAYDLNHELASSYFFDNIDRFITPDYTVIREDLLQMPSKQSGVNETRFEKRGIQYSVVSFEGIRAARRKFLHYFQNITLVVYCVDLSEYDNKENVASAPNKLAESIQFFDHYFNTWFTDASFLVVLSNFGLFKEKLRSRALNNFFPTYVGGANINSALQFISDQFYRVYLIFRNNILDYLIFKGPNLPAESLCTSATGRTWMQFLMLLKRQRKGINHDCRDEP